MAMLSELSSDPIKSLASSILADHTKSIDNSTLLYTQEGDFNQELTSRILPKVEQVIVESGGSRNLMRRIVSVLIEALQNAANHGTKTVEGSNFGQLSIIHNGAQYSLNICNVTLQSDSKGLIKKITDLNRLDKSEIRRLFIEVLCNEEFSEKGGAGLGLLTMAKKADQPIIISEKPLGNGLSYLSITLHFTKY